MGTVTSQKKTVTVPVKKNCFFPHCVKQPGRQLIPSAETKSFIQNILHLLYLYTYAFFFRGTDVQIPRCRRPEYVLRTVILFLISVIPSFITAFLPELLPWPDLRQLLKESYKKNYSAVPLISV